MQTCSRCNTESPDDVHVCPKCQADLGEFSMTAVALKRFQANPRVKSVIVVMHDDSCPACQAAQGAYAKGEAPKLPIEGCSHGEGCRCFYQPLLDEIYP